MLRKLMLTVLMLTGSAVWAQGQTVSSQRAVNAGNKTDELGVGLQAGVLTGLNLEYWLQADRTVAGAIAAERGNTALAASYNWHFRNLFSGDFDNFVPFVGAGLLGIWGKESDILDRSKNTSEFAMAAQIPMGIQFLPRMRRFAVFAEFAPSLELTPNSNGFLTGDLGARYYF